MRRVDLRGGLDVDILDADGGGGYWLPILAEAIDMKLNRLSNQLPNFLLGFSDSNAPWEVGDVCAEARVALFDDDGVLHGRYLSPACFRMLLRVPGGMSRLGFPATVTVPDFVGC